MDIHVCIMDDSARDINDIKSVLIHCFSEDEIYFDIYMDSLSFLPNVECDLYILDIDMPNKDGYHVAKEIYEVMPTAKIIFCTMHDDFVFSSFQFNPFYFIRKSHLEEDMSFAINKFKKSFQNKYLIYKESGNSKKVLLSKITRIESIRNYLILYLFDKTTLKIRNSIKDIQHSLNNKFIRISSGMLINMEYIKSINSKHVVLLNDDEMFPISRIYKENVLLKYNQSFMEN